MTEGRDMRIVSIPSLVAIVALVVAPTPATAQQADVTALLARIEQLEQTVRVLERRIAVLEAAATAPPVGQPQPATGTGSWRERASWRQVERGMTMDQVRVLLGEPDRVESGVFTYWYWGDIFEGGNVQFDADSRRVEGWSEPR